MVMSAESRKPLAYACGAALAIHAIGLSGYFLFRSKPVLMDEQKPAPNLPVCQEADNVVAGGSLRKAAGAKPGNARAPNAEYLHANYSVKKGQASVSSLYYLKKFPLPPESVNLDGIRFASDCKGVSTESYPYVDYSARSGQLPECPPQSGKMIGMHIRSQLLRYGNFMLEKRGPGQLFSLDMQYEVRGGKGIVLDIERTDLVPLRPEKISITAISPGASTNCSGSIVFRLDI
jgi:hypothetical protein